MKKLIAGAAAALSLVTGNAVADGPYRRPPPTIAAPVPVYAPPPTWSGFYIGAGIGAGAVLHNIEFFDALGPLARVDSLGGDGVLGTVIVGWDWQIGSSTVFGLFADYDFGGHSRSNSADFGLSHEFDHAWAVGARLGWLSNPAMLWYLTAGYTEASFDNFFGAPGGGFSRDRTFSGYFVGAGVDGRLAASNWFLRLEYRFSQFDSETVFPVDLAGVGVDVEPTVHTARLVLTYKLGGGHGWTMGR